MHHPNNHIITHWHSNVAVISIIIGLGKDMLPISDQANYQMKNDLQVIFHLINSLIWNTHQFKATQAGISAVPTWQIPVVSAIYHQSFESTLMLLYKK